MERTIKAFVKPKFFNGDKVVRMKTKKRRKIVMTVAGSLLVFGLQATLPLPVLAAPKGNSPEVKDQQCSEVKDGGDSVHKGKCGKVCKDKEVKKDPLMQYGSGYYCEAKTEFDQEGAGVQAQVELFEGTIHAEEADLEWASAAEQDLNEAFQRKEMAGIHPVNAECRATLCRMEVFLDGSASSEESLRRLISLTLWQEESFVLFERGSVVVYLSRKGYSLPRLME